MPAHAARLVCRLALALALSLAAACREIAPFDGADARGDAGSAGTGHQPSGAGEASEVAVGQLTGCGGLPYAGNACGDCLRQQCCDEAIDCANDPACLAKRACIARCPPGDVDCQGLCNSTIAYSDHAWFQLQQCMSAGCAEDCPQACGVGLPARSARCFQKEPVCCEAERAVWADSEKAAWLECHLHCAWAFLANIGVPGFGDDPCGCLAAHPAADGDDRKQEEACLYACTAPTPGALPDWSCLGAVTWPRVSGGSEVPEVHLNLADFLTLAFLPDLRVTQCAASDFLCSTPLGKAEVTDANGNVRLTLQRSMSSFDYFGYLLVQGDAVIDTLLYAFPPIRESQHFGHTLTTRQAAASAVGNPALAFADPALGSVAFSIDDCSYGRGSGVSVSSDPFGEVVYLAGGLLDPAAKETDASGTVVIFNLPPGSVHIQAKVAETGEPIGSVRVFVRAQAQTTFLLRPTPLED